MIRLWCFVLVVAYAGAMIAALEEAYGFAKASSALPPPEEESPMILRSSLDIDEDANVTDGSPESTPWTTELYQAYDFTSSGTNGRTVEARTTALQEGEEEATNRTSWEISVGSAPEGDELRALRERFRSLWPTAWWKTHGLYNDEYLLLINPHWLTFPPPRPSSHYILAVLYMVVMFVGVSGNFLVIFMFCRCKSLRTPANILVMNLAVSDSFLLLKMPIFIYNSIYLGPALGAFGCQVYGFLGGLTGTTSIATLAAIALDRYFVVLYPLEPLKVPTRARARACVLFAWTYGAIFSSMPLFGFNQYVPEGYLTSCSFDYLAEDSHSRYFILVFFAAAWFVPFTFISFCYASICRAVALAAAYSSSTTVRSVGKLSDRRDASSRRERQRRRTELRLAIVVLGVVALWFVSWTPYAVVALLGVSGNRRLVTPLASMVPALFCKMASCIDPFVYAITHPRFRRELARRFSCCVPKEWGKGGTSGGRKRGAAARDDRKVGRKRNSADGERQHSKGGERDGDEGTSVSEEEVVVMDARGSSIVEASEATSTSGENRNGGSRGKYSNVGPWTTEGRLYSSFPMTRRCRPFASWMTGRKKKIESKDADLETFSFRHPNLPVIEGKYLGKELELTV
uniref:Rh7-like protein n=1 Tax=Tanypteryx pryeri TaxID=126203 RepID=A0A0C6G506_TANPR|nr:opsin, rhodopsin-7 like [Tanypteryx pryeri]